MRQWSRFLSCRDKFESLLKQYDPAAFSREVEADWARVRNVEDCLGGQTARADANAIMKWATMLRLRYTVSFGLDSLDAGSGGLGLAGVGWEEAEQGRSSDSMR